MTDLTDLTPAQRGPVQRTGTTHGTTFGGAEQSIYWAVMPFEGGAEQSIYWAVMPFEGGAEQSIYWAVMPFEGGA